MLLSLINYSGGGCPIKNIEARLGGHLIQHKPVKKIYCENIFQVQSPFCSAQMDLKWNSPEKTAFYIYLFMLEYYKTSVCTI